MPVVLHGIFEEVQKNLLCASRIGECEQLRGKFALDADFLSDGPGHLRYARDFMSRRRVRKGVSAINRLYAIDASASCTSSVADHRVAVRPSQVESYARAIAAGLGAEVRLVARRAGRRQRR